MFENDPSTRGDRKIPYAYKMNWEDIFESITDPIIIISKDGNILYENQEAKNFALSEGLSYKNLIEDILNNKYIKDEINIKGLHKSFNRRDLEIDSYIQKDSIVIFIRDITRLTKLEEDLKREGKISTFSKLLAELFHDLKGPLSGLKAAIQYLKENPTETDLYDDMLNDIYRIEKFLKSVMDLAKPINLNFERENIHKVIDRVVDRYKSLFPDINIVKIYDPSLPDIMIDRDLLQRVIENILQNSVDEIKGEGTVWIKTGISTDNIYSSRMDKIFIKIKDSGKGVPEEIVDKIFLPFFSNKEKGTGVGLSNSYNIIKAHGGILRYIKDATFEILLPIR